MTLADSLAQAIVLSLPLVFSGGVHMAVVRLNLFAPLKVPIFRRWFGENKTWRGLLVIPLTTAVGVALVWAVWPDYFGGWNPFTLGILVGLAYAAAELPNSFIKRRLGIAPGKRPPRNAAWFALADQADSAIACALAYGLALRLAAGTVLLFIIVGTGIHLVVNYNLYLMRFRKEPL